MRFSPGETGWAGERGVFFLPNTADGDRTEGVALVELVVELVVDDLAAVLVVDTVMAALVDRERISE